MAHKKTRIARIAAELNDVPLLFTPLEKITYRVLALVLAIDLLVYVFRVLL